MSIASEITRLQNAKTSIKSAIEAKGVTVSSSLKIDEYAAKIAEIPTGGSSGYSITTNITNGTYSGATVTYPDATGVTVEAVVTLTPNTGYELIDVTVTNATHSIDWETGTVTLTHATDNIVITADVRQASIGLEFQQVSGTNYNVKGIGTCTDTNIVIPSKTPDGGNVIGIKDTAFQYNENITTVAIPYGVTSIDDYAFSDCDSLTSVTTGNGVTSIGEYAFYGCPSLTSVTIGNGVTSIGEYAFDYCSNLTSVYITDIAKWCAINFSDYNSNPLSYANNLYLNGELITGLIIPDSVTSIGDFAFEDCTNLTSVTIGNGVTSIGYSAFYDCSNLTSVTIPNSVTSIGSSAFYDCTNLTSVTIGNGVTSIGYSAFENCNFNDYSVTIYYNGYLSDIMNDSTYISDVITSLYSDFPDLTVTFIDLNETSQDIPLSEFFGGGGSGSGSGSGY